MKQWLFLLLAMPLAAAALDNPDSDFYTKAMQSGLAEVDGGQLAQQRSKNPQVLAFAGMMVKDHSAANSRLRDIAVSNSVDLPIAMNSQQAAKRAKLAGLTGDDFDRSYIEWQIFMHRDAIALFKMEAESGDDREARQFAADTLPTVQSHLKELLAMPVIQPPPAAPAAP